MISIMFRLLFKREIEWECRSTFVIVFRFDLSFVGLDDRFADDEP